ncbi:heparan sulfate 2-O-sulfotransferase pipe isoform X8 [Drosophila montana]|uniref:heparan sulfate 2-O-sulfotransferase pipe isoform X8 n=1 Tax=Drosophila montana TaxID=40370 RepID=UPI00313AAE7C
MSLNADRSYKMKLRDVENAFKYRRIPYPKRSVELIALLAISCTFFLFMHTNKLNSRLKEMEVKLQPSEFSALGLTGNHISGHDAGKHDDINTLHGTYQYLKSTGQARRDPKHLFETILLDTGFARNLLKAEILNCSTANSYTKHVAFLNFAAFGHPWPIYINLVRDPIERLVSWFYYARAPWYLADRVNAFGSDYKIPTLEWLQKDFNRCILEHDPECVYEQSDTGHLGDHRRQTLFFCGQQAELCMPFNSQEAMQQAKRNVEKRYAVVGTWEDTNTTLSVLEAYIPRYFAGAKDVYYAMRRDMENVNRNAFRPTISEEARALLSRNLTQEIEFYQFVRQRLNKQHIALQLEKDRSVSG